MSAPAAILALLTGVAGWYYLFFSKSAGHLASLEDPRLNRWRARLRRIGGAVMVLLGVGLYVGFRSTEEPVQPGLFIVVWSAVIILLGGLVALAFTDVWLTRRLRSQRLRQHQGKPIEPRSPDDASTHQP